MYQVGKTENGETEVLDGNGNLLFRVAADDGWCEEWAARVVAVLNSDSERGDFD